MLGAKGKATRAKSDTVRVWGLWMTFAAPLANLEKHTRSRYEDALFIALVSFFSLSRCIFGVFLYILASVLQIRKFRFERSLSQTLFPSLFRHGWAGS